MRVLREGAQVESRYTLTRRLGRGAINDVWLAFDNRADSQVALKFLTGEFAADPKFAALLKREWRIGSRLMHANIARVFEYHDVPDGDYFGLQFVGQTDISALTGCTPELALPPVAMLADALRYAHAKGVIHRDVKAANILLDSRGLPYLTDFGVATDSADPVEISGGGTDIASSPQQQASQPGEAADDIYALGVLTHELLTGVPPVNGSVLDSLAQGEPLTEDLRALLKSMLRNDAAERPDADRVAAELLAAGYAPGPAPANRVAGEGASDALVQPAATRPLRRTRVRVDDQAAMSAGTDERKSGGISPTTLYGGLTAAGILIISVFFVLPGVVNKDPAPDVTTPGNVLEEGAAPASIADEQQDVTPDNEQNANARLPDSQTSFSENVAADGPTSTAQLKAATDDALGDLLSQLERLRFRAIERWGGQEYLDAVDVYAAGDQAYVDRNYRRARERYLTASELLDPFFARIDTVFAETLSAAQAAFDARDYVEAVRLFDLATSITPGNRVAEAGFERAKSLQAVLALMLQGEQFEENLEFEAAVLAFEKALELDALWTPATDALARVRAALTRQSFEQRMTEGFDALLAGDFDSAKAAFNAAKSLDPKSRQPADGLLQVDQEIRLADIRRLEEEALSLNSAEQWETSVGVYEAILKIDPDLQFAQTGLATASSRAALHERITRLISAPDTLSDQANIRSATAVLLEIAKVQPTGPRLDDQKNELSRLLKRAATPLPVQIISDNLTNVAIFKVGKLGTFASQELNLRPGVYVAAGNRTGYRDVRVEFRVAPEVEMKPIVVQCEEPI